MHCGEDYDMECSPEWSATTQHLIECEECRFTKSPSTFPTNEPTNPTRGPSTEPTAEPTYIPSTEPSSLPSYHPSDHPTDLPTAKPSESTTFQETILVFVGYETSTTYTRPGRGEREVISGTEHVDRGRIHPHNVIYEEQSNVSTIIIISLSMIILVLLAVICRLQHKLTRRKHSHKTNSDIITDIPMRDGAIRSFSSTPPQSPHSPRSLNVPQCHEQMHSVSASLNINLQLALPADTGHHKQFTTKKDDDFSENESLSIETMSGGDVITIQTTETSNFGCCHGDC